MRITSIALRGFRSFPQLGPISLDQMTLLIGPNNSGKSTILRGLQYLQDGLVPDPATDFRRGVTECSVTVGLSEPGTLAAWGGRDATQFIASIQATGHVSRTLAGVQNQWGVGPIPNVEPNHFIVPYLSKRKAAGYSEDVRLDAVHRILPALSNLGAKLSRLGTPAFPAHARYASTCESILGFVVTAIPSANGQVPGVYLQDTSTLTISQMGEGVANIVGLLADLALSKGKLFLIEEPENDLHPQALKALLELVNESSAANQFVVSTHSHIVLRYLAGARNSRVYYIDAKRGVLPTEATVREVEPTPAARLAVLRDLGYDFGDFDLWDGWLFLEESSAERIIRDFLIPWFAPKLSRIRLLAAGGNSQAEPVVQDFVRLVRFTHMEEAYRDRTWVLIDGDEEGRTIVERLRSTYAGWPPDRFDTFDQAQFEQYYPDEFAAEVAQVLAVKDKKARREAKKNLLNKVREWLDADQKRGREELAKSAASVISQLKRVESQLFAANP